MIRSDIRSLARTYISQTDTNNTDFTNADLNGFIDEATRKLAAIVKKPIKRVSFQVTDNVASYAIATYTPDLIIPTKAYFGDVSISGDVEPMAIITEEALAELSPSWLETTSNSKGKPIYLVRDGANLVIAPRPNSTEGATGKKVYITYVYQPAAISSDSAEPDMPIVYHELLAKYVAHLCYLTKLNKPDLATSLLSQIYDEARKFSELIVKEAVPFGFSWGSFVDPDDFGVPTVNP